MQSLNRGKNTCPLKHSSFVYSETLKSSFPTGDNNTPFSLPSCIAANHSHCLPPMIIIVIIIIIKYLIQMTTKQISFPLNRYLVCWYKPKHSVIRHMIYFAWKVRNFFSNDYFHSKIKVHQD